LFDGAQIPKMDQLPEDIKELASGNGLDVRHGSFDSHMDKVVFFLRTGTYAKTPPYHQDHAQIGSICICYPS
jgi:hypothetical protein